VCPDPADTAATVYDDRPDTETGVAASAVVPLPSCPHSFVPQHLMPAAEVTSHVWEELPEMRTGVGDAVAGWARVTITTGVHKVTIDASATARRFSARPGLRLRQLA
jgi:hypothetical protein